MTVSLTTPFRSLPTLPIETWRKEFKDRSSPLTADEIGDCFAACQGWAVLLDQAIGESSLRDEEAIRRKNLLGMKTYDNSAFLEYSDYWKPFAHKYKELYDPGYKAGAYYPFNAPGIDIGGHVVEGYNLSLAGYKVIYQGGPLCLSSRGANCANTETYDPNKSMLGVSVVTDPNAPSINRSIAASMLRYERWFGTSPPPSPPPPTGDLRFGRVPKPTWQDRQIPDRNNSAWDNLGQRMLRGVVYHRMVGTLWGTDGWFRGGGGRSGLTDFGIDNSSGETLEWNDYRGRGRAGISANRAGWASGPWENPPGDGRAFVAKYGVSAINRDLVSLEIAGNYDSPISGVALQQIVALSAYLADQAEVPWTNYPLNPETGLVFTYWHSDFQNHKPCPGALVRVMTTDIIERTKALLRQYQS